jgi:hypothetical protein
MQGKGGTDQALIGSDIVCNGQNYVHEAFKGISEHKVKNSFITSCFHQGIDCIFVFHNI